MLYTCRILFDLKWAIGGGGLIYPNPPKIWNFCTSPKCRGLLSSFCVNILAVCKRSKWIKALVMSSSLMIMTVSAVLFTYCKNGKEPQGKSMAKKKEKQVNGRNQEPLKKSSASDVCQESAETSQRRVIFVLAEINTRSTRLKFMFTGNAFPVARHQSNQKAT